MVVVVVVAGELLDLEVSVEVVEEKEAVSSRRCCSKTATGDEELLSTSSSFRRMDDIRGVKRRGERKFVPLDQVDHRLTRAEVELTLT